MFLKDVLEKNFVVWFNLINFDLLKFKSILKNIFKIKMVVIIGWFVCFFE